MKKQERIKQFQELYTPEEQEKLLKRRAERMKKQEEINKTGLPELARGTAKFGKWIVSTVKAGWTVKKEKR